MDKEAVKLLRRLRQLGYETEFRGHHWKVLREGVPVADPSNGQLISIPNTPSDSRNWKNVQSSLRRAGILESKRK